MKNHPWLLAIAVSLLVSVPLIGNTECPSEPVPFAKVVNPAFVADYEKCTVITEVQFLAAGPSEGWAFAAIPKEVRKGRTAFRVLAPGEVEPTGGPFGTVLPHVFVEKSAADLVFELKRGDLIAMKGHPFMGKIKGHGAPDFVEVIFVADSLERIVTSPDSTKIQPAVMVGGQDEMSFAKVMNPAFAADYSNVSVRTRVTFVANGQTEGYMFGAIPQKFIKGLVPFRVSAPGEAAAMVPPHVFIEKKMSDLLFELKTGDAIILIGHPAIGTMGGGAAPFTQVVFIATGIERAP